MDDGLDALNQLSIHISSTFKVRAFIWTTASLIITQVAAWQYSDQKGASLAPLVFLELFKMWYSSVQFSHSIVSDSLQPHESWNARPPCPSPIPGVHSNSCPTSWWCHPAISSSVVPFSSCPQSLPASESFPMSQPFAWGDQSIGVSASVSVLPKNTQDWSPSEWTGWISLQSKGLSRVFSNTFFGAQLSSSMFRSLK